MSAEKIAAYAALITAIGALVMQPLMLLLTKRMHRGHDEIARKTLEHVKKHLTNGAPP